MKFLFWLINSERKIKKRRCLFSFTCRTWLLTYIMSHSYLIIISRNLMLGFHKICNCRLYNLYSIIQSNTGLIHTYRSIPIFVWVILQSSFLRFNYVSVVGVVVSLCVCVLSGVCVSSLHGTHRIRIMLAVLLQSMFPGFPFRARRSDWWICHVLHSSCSSSCTPDRELTMPKSLSRFRFLNNVI